MYSARTPVPLKITGASWHYCTLETDETTEAASGKQCLNQPFRVRGILHPGFLEGGSTSAERGLKSDPFRLQQTYTVILIRTRSGEIDANRVAAESTWGKG